MCVVCMCVCMFAHTCAHICIGGHAHVCPCVWRPKLSVRSIGEDCVSLVIYSIDLVYCVGQLPHVQSFLHFMNKFGLFYMLLNLDCYYFVQDFVVSAFYGYWYVVVLFCVVLAWFCHWGNMILEGVSRCYIKI